MKTLFPWKIFFNSLRVKFVIGIFLCLIVAYLEMNNLTSFLILFACFITYSFIELYLNLRPLHKIKSLSESIKESLPSKFQPVQVINEDDWQKIHRVLQNTDQFVARIDKLIYEQNITSENLLEGIFDAIIIIDPYLNCLTFNQTFLRFFTPNSIINFSEKQKIWKFISDDKILMQFRHALESTEPIKLSPYQINHKSFDIVISPLIDADKRVIGALGIFHDITKNIQIDKMRVDFVANVSHEIRTPLTSIKGYAQLLEANQEQISSELRPFIKKIVSNTDKMISLFSDLLDLSVIESKDEITKEHFNLENLFLGIKEKLRGKYLQDNWRVQLNIKVETIYGNSRLLEQAFTNLIDNAIKYGHTNDSLIEVNAQKENEMIEISISDNGQGIEETHLERIFERFYRVSSEQNKNVEGKGLGLSIVKHIILKHHGEILATKKEPQGLCFKIKLPLV
jgi:two-component system phosphate regulon sensor histidine kinase PhoR